MSIFVFCYRAQIWAKTNVKTWCQKKFWRDLSLRECNCNCNNSHCLIAATLLVICQLPIQNEPNNNHSFEDNTRQLPSPFSIHKNWSIDSDAFRHGSSSIHSWTHHFHIWPSLPFALFCSLSLHWRDFRLKSFFCVNFHKNRPDFKMKLTVILLWHTVIQIG